MTNVNSKTMHIIRALYIKIILLKRYKDIHRKKHAQRAHTVTMHRELLYKNTQFKYNKTTTI